MLKYSLHIFIATLAALVVIVTPKSQTNSSGAPEGYTGSVSDSQNTCTQCHQSTNVSPSQNSTLEIINNVGQYYIPGETYDFTITVNANWSTKFGFLACFENENGEKIGDIIINNPSQTQLTNNGNYITHTNSGTIGQGSNQWQFSWQAPLSIQGSISLYVSSVVANSNGINTGDEVLTNSFTMQVPYLGCMDQDALNYNPQATIDNGSCAYELLNGNSPLNLSYSSSTFVGTTNDFEITSYIDVINTSDEPLDIMVLRNVLSEPSANNWFCWNICYLPNIDQSTTPATIDSNASTSIFSGHIVPELYGATYDIEYCFFPENQIDDSICATIHYVVEGEVLGCTDNNALNYSANANTDDGTCVLYPQPPWPFVQANNEVHTVAIPANISMNIDGNNISVGDWIGAFYNTESGMICAGYTEWMGISTDISVYGYDSLTDDGFEQGAPFIWQVWDASEGVSWMMNVSYNNEFTHHGIYQSNGLSALSGLENINPISSQTIEIPNGWSLFSTYMMTDDMDVSSIFEPVEDQLLVVKDNDGWAYLVAYDYNAVGDLEPGQGYLIKVTSPVDITIDGAHAKPETHPLFLQEGWNMIGFLPTTEVNAEDVLYSLVFENELIIAKDFMGNAYIPDWNFNGIGTMKPGQGYQIKTTAATVLYY